jgi:TolA-binding protein
LCLFHPCAYSFTYAFAYLYCDRQYQDIEFRSGSDDGLLALLNGQVVQRVQMERGSDVDQDRAVVTLEKGWNRLLCKVDDYGGGHGLIARFKQADGQVISDYKICLVRPPEGTETRFVAGAAYEAQAAALLKEAMKLSAEKGDLDAAAAKCREVVARYPKAQAAAEAMYRGGAFQAQAGHTQQAMAVYSEVLAKYPYSKWIEDTLLAQAEILAAGGDAAGAEKALSELVTGHPASNLSSEAMLRLSALQAQRKDLDAAAVTLSEIRHKYPNTVESVMALERLADHQKARGKTDEAAKLYQQTIAECQQLSEGKYVFFVNVQAVLEKVSQSARAKMEGR